MSIISKIKKRVARRVNRVRSKVKGTGLPRVSVFRSLSNIYAQIIDDKAQATLVSCSTLELKNLTGDKKAKAHAVGLELAKRAAEKNINAACFDRGAFLYGGRVKALAEGLRAGGLKI
ncbi:MAG: 50S ribosomal protein L18 [candidate division TM6 bacterium GW2011_GWF2_32_72]|nr:MAG: 50S ribosomal protein L18 [candidate division TM6 bacterium GW2011_GWF2_32_72]